MDYEENEELQAEESTSTNIFDSFTAEIEAHPREAGAGLLTLLGLLGLSNLVHWIARNKEKKRHEKSERLQKEAIKKQAVQINDLQAVAEKAEHLETVNDALTRA